MKVLFLPEVRQYLSELYEVLFEKEYFSFDDSAVQYVSDLIYDIEETLPIRLSREAPPFFERYGKGMKYASFRKNRNTRWYVFFNKYIRSDEEIYLVRCITNNHVIAQHLQG